VLEDEIGLRLVAPTDDWRARGDMGPWTAPFRAGMVPAIVASTRVSMYLTKETTEATLRQVATLPAGSLLAMTFLLPTNLVDAADRPGYEAAMAGAERSGTPFISLYSPEEVVALATRAGFAHAQHVSSTGLTARYFAGRPDGLHPSTGEDFLVAQT
jgi:O-methyltransferase involved in polyketide biosynthesis